MTTLAAITEQANTTHSHLVEKVHLAIYINKSRMEGKKVASTVTMIFLIPREVANALDREQTILKSMTNFTRYSKELIGLKLVVKIVEDHPRIEKPIAVFYNN